MAAIYPWLKSAIISGVCGTSNDLSQGELLSVVIMQVVNAITKTITQQDPGADGVSFNNTTVVSFTAAFSRFASPDPGLEVPIIDLANLTGTGGSTFRVAMDSNGYIKVTALNISGTKILDVEITNNGGSFANSIIHMMALVIDLTDVAKREIWIDTLDVTDNTSYVTWNIYTNDTIQLADLADPSNPRMIYHFGIDNSYHWGQGGTHNGTTDFDYDALAFVSFDDTCSLICGSVWDTAGYIRDPGAWEGWYKVQPQVAYMPSFWKNSGKTAPATYQANSMELDWVYGYASSSTLKSDFEHERLLIHLGIGGITEAV